MTKKQKTITYLIISTISVSVTAAMILFINSGFYPVTGVTPYAFYPGLAVSSIVSLISTCGFINTVKTIGLVKKFNSFEKRFPKEFETITELQKTEQKLEMLNDKANLATSKKELRQIKSEIFEVTNEHNKTIDNFVNLPNKKCDIVKKYVESLKINVTEDDKQIKETKKKNVKTVKEVITLVNSTAENNFTKQNDLESACMELNKK